MSERRFETTSERALELLQKGCALEPQLTIGGIWCPNLIASGTYESNRQKLLDNEPAHEGAVDSAVVCCEWLLKIGKNKQINTRHTSYGLKHHVENYFNSGNEYGYVYVANGVFIAVARGLGFDMRCAPGSPNPSFNMSEKDINKCDREEREIRRKLREVRTFAF